MTELMNSSICMTRVDHPSAWKGSDFPSADEYAFDLSPRHYDAFDKALSEIRQQGLTLDDIKKEHFEVSEIAAWTPAFGAISFGSGSMCLMAVQPRRRCTFSRERALRGTRVRLRPAKVMPTRRWSRKTLNWSLSVIQQIDSKEAIA